MCCSTLSLEGTGDDVEAPDEQPERERRWQDPPPGVRQDARAEGVVQHQPPANRVRIAEADEAQARFEEDAPDDAEHEVDEDEGTRFGRMW